MVPLLVPEVVPLKLRKVPLVTEADQLSVPPPALLIPTVWLAGLLPPCTAVKDSEVGLTFSTGPTTETVDGPPMVKFTTVLPSNPLAPVILAE
jgi:hypothetical protein